MRSDLNGGPILTDAGGEEPRTGAGKGRLRGRPSQRRRWAEVLLHPGSGLTVFAMAVGIIYGVVPLVIYETVLPAESFARLASITAVGVCAMLLGGRLPLFDGRFRRDATRLVIDENILVGAIWSFFALFVLVTFATARTIPLLSAIRGVDPAILSEQRGAFLKGRRGAEIGLLYLSTLFVNTLLPYTVVLLYAEQSRLRHWFAGSFLFFSISFLQKALFLNLVLPLLAYFAFARKLRGTKATTAFVASAALLLVGVTLSFATPASPAAAATPADFLTAKFAPTSPIQYFLWRAFAVPIFTATDTLLVHADYFDGRALLGATSSLIAGLFGMERINLERFVFEYQFGGWNDTANSNAVFLVDAYVNFSWWGVIVFGLVVGQVFRWFRLSKDSAFSSLWPLFALVLFSASLIGMLFSNGFLLMMFFALVMRPIRPLHRRTARSATTYPASAV